MNRFLLDENLPARIPCLEHTETIHASALGAGVKDYALWAYAREHTLVIVTKDSDFSDWIILREPPPKVVHLRLGNLRRSNEVLSRLWPNVDRLLETHKLINVYEERVEGIG